MATTRPRCGTASSRPVSTMVAAWRVCSGSSPATVSTAPAATADDVAAAWVFGLPLPGLPFEPAVGPSMLNRAATHWWSEAIDPVQELAGRMPELWGRR